MKPAFSVLVFTVTSGAGYGLLIWMVLFQLIAGESVNLNELIGGGLVGVVLVTVGLLSSTLHLANPKNAWRAFNRFKTSWLSREGVFALLFYPPILGYALLLWLNKGAMSIAIGSLGLLAIVIALTTVVCTGMIYASLKPIRQWHNPLTAPLYILFSLMSGSLLLIAVQLAVHGKLSTALAGGFIVITLLTAACKWRYFASIGKPEGATINTATGFSQARVRLLDAGHTADTFLTNEFGYDAGALKLVKLRRMMQLLAFVLPIALVALAHLVQQSALAYLALVPAFAGLLLERWLFFAEARHVVRLYHGDQRT